MAQTTSDATGVVVHTGERPTVEVIGRTDRHSVGQLSGAIRGLHAVGMRDVVVDVSQMLTCDPRLLTTLARERARFSDSGGHLAIVGVRVPDFLAAFDAAAVDEIFVIYDAVRHESQVG